MLAMILNNSVLRYGAILLAFGASLWLTYKISYNRGYAASDAAAAAQSAKQAIEALVEDQRLATENSKARQGLLDRIKEQEKYVEHLEDANAQCFTQRDADSLRKLWADGSSTPAK